MLFRSELLFKDKASLTRMINIMVKNGFFKRFMNQEDRRKFVLEITPKGTDVIKKLSPIIKNNRTESLLGLTQTELKQLENILNKIKSNCK